MKTTTSYEFLCVPGDTDALLKSTVNFYTKAVRFASDFILSLHGGISSPRDELMLLSSWFSLEKETDRKGLSPNEVKSRFKTYWNELFDQPYDEVVIDNVLSSPYKDSVWVDRREAFKATNFTAQDVKNLFSEYYDFPSNKFWRSWYSEVFGTGGKSNKGVIAENYLRVFKLIENDIDHNGVYAKVVKEFGSEEALKVAISPKGRTAALIGKLMAIRDGKVVDIKLLKELCQKSYDKKQTQAGRNYSDAVKQIIPDLKDLLNIKTLPMEVFVELMSLADAAVRSVKTRFVDEANAKLELVRNYLKREPEVRNEIKTLKEFAIIMSKELDITHYSIRKQQAQGYREFRNQLNQLRRNPPSQEDLDEMRAKRNETLTNEQLVVEIAIEYAKDAYAGKFGTINLMRFLADRPDGNYEEAADVLDLKERVDNKKLIPFTHFSEEHPAYPNFGTSRPHQKLIWGKPQRLYQIPLVKGQKETTLGQKDQVVRAVELLLFNGHDFVKTTIPVLGRRGVDEYFYKLTRDNDVELPRALRNHPFKTRVNLVQECGNECGTKLYSKLNWRGHKHWYLKLAPTFDLPKLEQKEHPRVLGIDLRWILSDIAYSVVQESPDGLYGFVTKKAGKRVNFDVISTGTWSIPMNDADVSPEELAWSNRLAAQMGNDELQAKTRRYLYRELTRQLRRYARRSPDEAKKMLFSILESYLPRAFGRQLDVGTFNYGIGSCSRERLEALENLMRAAKTCASKCEPDPVLNTVIERIQDKFNNVRQERWRLIANKILKLAIENKVDFVTLEDLDGKTSRTTTRYINRNTTGWYVRRIQDYLKQNLAMHSIGWREVEKEFTSHQDIDFSPVVKLERVSFANLTTEQKDRLKKMSRSTAALGTSPLYREAALRILEGQEPLREADAMFLPRRNGYYACSKSLGIVRSDVLASIVIALKLIRILCGGNPKEKQEAAVLQQI